jgi:hypothetical protein
MEGRQQIICLGIKKVVIKDEYGGKDILYGHDRRMDKWTWHLGIKLVREKTKLHAKIHCYILSHVITTA